MRPVDDRRLSEVARHVIAPTGIKSTAWPKVRETCKRLGWEFDGWQDGAGRLIVSKRSDGSYAADTIVLSIPRQVGKTYLIACIIFALCLLEPGLTVIWTAHRKTTAAETFRQFDGMAQRPKVAPHVRQVLRGRGDERIVFNNGSRILFGARESGFGRGMTDVDILVLDEGQILKDDTLEDMGATQNVAANPLTFVAGTPPRPKDPGGFFTLLRREALDGESEGSLFVELSADRDADLMDRDQWRKANPSFPLRTTERAMLRLRKKLKNDDSWRREALGIWDEAVRALIVPTWPLLATPAQAGKPTALGVAMDPDRVWLSCGLASGDKVPHLAPVVSKDKDRVLRVRAADPKFGKAQFVAEVARISKEQRAPVVIDRKGPASDLEDDLRAAGAKVVGVGLDDYVTACADLYDAVEAKEVSHGGYEDLDAAVAAADWRRVGDRRVFARRNGDISMLEAVTLAHWAASQSVTTDAWGFWS